MQCFTVIQCHDPQVLAQFIYVQPMSNSPVVLNFNVIWLAHCLLAPFQRNIRPLLKHAPLKVLRLLHQTTRAAASIR